MIIQCLSHIFGSLSTQTVVSGNNRVTKDTKTMSSDSLAIATMPPSARSRVTNGSAVLPNVDGRSTWVRRLRDVMALHLSDLGGEAAVSEAERSIIRRASTLTVELERMESEFANADEADRSALDLYQRTAGNLRRLLESIGLERRARGLTPTIDQYLRDKAATTAASAPETIPATDGVEP